MFPDIGCGFGIDSFSTLEICLLCSNNQDQLFPKSPDSRSSLTTGKRVWRFWLLCKTSSSSRSRMALGVQALSDCLGLRASALCTLSAALISSLFSWFSPADSRSASGKWGPDKDAAAEPPPTWQLVATRDLHVPQHVSF